MLGQIIHWTGRNHAKLLITDNFVALPCFNLGDTDYGRPDLAVLTTNPDIITPITELFHAQHQGQQLTDSETICNSETSLFFDAGQRGKSLTLDRAVDIVNEAKSSVIFSSQIAPDGSLKTALENAHKRGVEVKPVVPEWQSITDPLIRISALLSLVKSTKCPLQIYYAPRWVHAKFIAADSNIALVGSHTFSTMGVQGGTAELNLLSTNPNLISGIYAFHDRLYKS